MKLPRFAVFLILALPHQPGRAQTDIFADPENLQILPQDIAPAELRSTMRQFAMGLGVRCETCHLGEAGQDLSTFDFASDEREEKRVAREMMKMVASINGDHLARLDKPDTTRVQCVTCHRGVRNPRLSGDVLGKALADGGFDNLESTYRKLRDRYYGSHSYDFSPGVLAGLAQNTGLGGDLDTAVAILELNLEYSPRDFQTHFLLGEVHLRREDKAAARKHYEEALGIMPNPMVQRRLQELE
ncbi:MAG: c-type cytochrome [Xanthomonadales bacterium]|nr:c-type cytochrome [Xanthomonadales bacterium]